MLTFDDIAQLVERQAVNLLVVGSSPSIVAISIGKKMTVDKLRKSFGDAFVQFLMDEDSVYNWTGCDLDLCSESQRKAVVLALQDTITFLSTTKFQ